MEYLICIDATGTLLTKGKKYLCKKSGHNFSVWTEGNKHMGTYSKRRFKKPETFTDSLNCEALNFDSLLEELNRIELKRNELIKKIKKRHKKIGQQLDLL
jgi:hypothetical protein